MCYSTICNSVAEVYLPKFVCSSANTLKVWVGGHVSATRLRYFLAPFNAISLQVPLPVPRRRNLPLGLYTNYEHGQHSTFPKATNLTVPRLPKRPIGPEPFQVYVNAVSIKLIAEPVRGESNPIHRKCQPFITTSGVIPILIATTI